MGSALKKIGSVFGLDKSATPKFQQQQKSLYEIGNEVKPYQTALDAMMQNQAKTSQAAGALSPQVMQQMGQAVLGQAPSLATQQMKLAQDRNLAQQAALMAGSRGGNSSMAQRLLAQNMGNAGRDIAQQSAIDRLQERDRFLQHGLAADQALMAGSGQALNTALMPKRELQAHEQARVAIANEQAKANAEATAKKRGALMGGLGAGMGMLGGGGEGGGGLKDVASLASTFAMFSDENLKEDIKPADGKDMDKFLDAISAKEYKYKEGVSKLPGAAPGERTGILAQDLEKSKVGKQLVKDTPVGKAVDIGQSVGALLASQAHLNEKIKKLEKKGKK